MRFVVMHGESDSRAAAPDIPGTTIRGFRVPNGTMQSPGICRMYRRNLSLPNRHLERLKATETWAVNAAFTASGDPSGASDTVRSNSVETA
jgi:hypothetical protein